MTAGELPPQLKKLRLYATPGKRRIQVGTPLVERDRNPIRRSGTGDWVGTLEDSTLETLNRLRNKDLKELLFQQGCTGYARLRKEQMVSKLRDVGLQKLRALSARSSLTDYSGKCFRLVGDTGAEEHILDLHDKYRALEGTIRVPSIETILETANGEAPVTEICDCLAAGGVIMEGMLFCESASASLASIERLDQDQRYRYTQGSGVAELTQLDHGYRLHLTKDRGLYMLEDPFEIAGACSRCGERDGLAKCGTPSCWAAMCEGCTIWDRQFGIGRCWICTGIDEYEPIESIRKGLRWCISCTSLHPDTHPQYRICRECVGSALTNPEICQG